MAGQDIECLLDLGEAAPLDGVAEEMLAAVVVASGVEFEQPVADVIRLRCLLRGLGVRRLELTPTPVRMRASSCTSSWV